MRVVTIVGARPQFIKAAAVSRALRAAGIEEILVHTGQHYDANMSDVFFDRLNLDHPKHHLGIGSAPHGAQTGRMLEAIERVLVQERPDMAIVYGDTNSTLAGALAAVKLRIPVAHIEAGLRSFNRAMPEELNRLLTDHCSSLLFAPTDRAADNLTMEGITQGVFRTGDVMFDTAMLFEREVGAEAANVPARFGVSPGEFVFLTIHRAENTDDPTRWSRLATAIRRVSEEIAPIIWPVHPRTRPLAAGLASERVKLLEPLAYFETQALLMNARVALTDSGGLQKEAAFHRTPCITLRDETEWVELTQAGVNWLAGCDPACVVELTRNATWPATGIPPNLYGNGKTALVIAHAIKQFGSTVRNASLLAEESA